MSIFTITEICNALHAANLEASTDNIDHVEFILPSVDTLAEAVASVRECNMAAYIDPSELDD